MKYNLVDLTERVFQREGSLSIASSDRRACLSSDAVKNCNVWSCQKLYVKFGSILHRHIISIPMGTNFAPLVADIFLYEWNFKLFPSESTQADVMKLLFLPLGIWLTYRILTLICLMAK